MTNLGKVVGQGQVRPVEAKVITVQEFPAPFNTKELMRFLGLVGYYCAFCKNFSTAVAPLTNLLKAKTEYIWPAACQRAFVSAKALLCSAPVLAAPRFDRPFLLHVDALILERGPSCCKRMKRELNALLAFSHENLTKINSITQ